MSGGSDVLVVGAGPTGLTLACELRRHGASVRIVDELAEPHVWSKAAAVHARTMEVFDDMGVAEQILARAKPLVGMRIFDRERQVGRVGFESIDSHYPHVFGCSQRDTEEVLAQRLSDLGGAVERGRKVVGLALDDEGARASLDDGTSIASRYVVGCDGAHSLVRKTLGISFEGHAYEEHLIQADLRVDFAEAGEKNEICAFLGPEGPVAMFPLFKDGRYRVVVVLSADAGDVEPTLETFRRFVTERGPSDAVLADPAWMVPFRIHCRRANHYRRGRAFIAGDAAHIHSPAGGQGMNTGIQDAYNLGWKLALVTRGRAPEGLLDSYEAERLPIAEQLLARTDAATRGIGHFGMLQSGIAARVRDELIGFLTSLDAFSTRMTAQLSMLEIRYPKSPIVAEDRPALLRTNVTCGAADEAPGLADRAAFGGGPAPGDRAPDVAVGDRRRVGDLLRGSKHVLFLFDGSAATPAGYRRLAAVAQRVRERYDDVVACHVVVPRPERPAELRAFEGSVLLDAGGAMHERYGARSESLYLVRPDGYVGYRAQPADGDKLARYLETIFSCGRFSPPGVASPQ